MENRTDTRAHAGDLAIPVGILSARAASLARDGRYREAREWLEQLLKQRTDPDLYCLLGKVHSQQAEHDLAAAAFEAALREDSGHIDAAAALVRVHRMRTPVPRARQRASVLGAALLGVLVTAGIAGIVRVEASPATPLTGSEPGLVGVPTDFVPPGHANFEEYARVAVSLSSFEAWANLNWNADHTEEGITVVVGGSVPTDHFRDRVLESAKQVAPSLQISADGLAVDARYVVRPGDQLSRIAHRFYGDIDRWRDVWRANARSIEDPDQIAPGLVLAMPRAS